MPRLHHAIGSMTTNHFGATSCTRVKIQRWSKIQTAVLRGGYVAEDGAFRAQKWCGSKQLSTAPKSHVRIMSYPTTTRGRPLVIPPCSDPEEDSVNEQGLIAETSTQSINRKHGSYGQGDRTVSPRYHDGQFLLAGPY
jgi:hypothetical protein